MNPDSPSSGASPPPRGGTPVTETIVWDREKRDVSLVRLAAVLLRHRRRLVLWPAVAAIIAGLVGLVLPRTWTATSAFLPQSQEGQLSQLGGLAAQFGLNVPLPGSNGESPQFYAALLKSQQLLEEAAESRYPSDRSADDTTTTDLVQVYDVDADTRAEEVFEAAKELGDDIDVNADGTTGLVQLQVHMPGPRLSKAVAERLIDLVNKFNLQSRQSQAAAERRFLDERVRRARADLTSTEDSLQRFLEANRSYQNSPQLRFEYQRLQRRVDLRQQVYTTLAQSLEQARISEVRNTPVITVVEPPELPAKPDSRGLFAKAFLGATTGLLVTLVVVFSIEFGKTERDREPADFDRLSKLWQDTRHDVGKLLARLKRYMPRGRGSD